MANAPTGIFDVSTPSRDQMDVAMENGLACYLTDVLSNIESIYRWITLAHDLPDQTDQLVARRDLV